MLAVFFIQVEAFVYGAGDNDGDARAGDEHGDPRTQMISSNVAQNSTVSKMIYKLVGEHKYDLDEFRVTRGYQYELSIK